MIAPVGGVGRPLSARLAVASAVLAAVGVVCLLAMFTAFAVGATSFAMVVGRINDTLVLVAYLLAAPGLMALWAIVRPSAPVLGGLAAALGIVAIGAIAVLQALLVLEVVPFEQQVGPVTLALLAFGVSVVLMGVAGRRGGTLPGGVRQGLIGATYFGFPLWALWTARQLARHAADPRVGHPQPVATTPTN